MERFESAVLAVIAVLVALGGVSLTLVYLWGRASNQEIVASQIIALFAPPVAGLIALLAMYARGRKD
jgi:hypothetical protein